MTTDYRQWTEVRRILEALGDRQDDARAAIVAAALAADADPTGRSADELAEIFRWHDELTHGACECGSCTTHYNNQEDQMNPENDTYDDYDPHEQCLGIHKGADGEHYSCDGRVI